MTCPKCGKEIDDNAKKCPYCGYELTQADLSASGSGEAAEEKPKYFNETRKRQSLILLVVCIVAVVLCQVFHLK
ncbi:MAG: zinc-ribbon domain-containing protein [Anaerovoracaceae bacterium]|jgi:uncharacterized membrane protein YvbJ